ncbi:MAG TPA: hypothetical protein VGD62_05990 [Acidobacteriaceae bacterium]
MKRMIYWVTILSGVGAAYLMYRRGESLGTIANKAVTNPIGTFAAEVRNAV